MQPARIIAHPSRVAAAIVLAVALLGAVAVAGTAKARPSVGPPPETVPGQIIVKFEPPTAPGTITAAEVAAGATVVEELDGVGVRVLRTPPARADQAVEALRRNPKVAYAEHDGVARPSLTPNDPEWGRQWGNVKAGAPEAWETTTGHPSVVVAVLDTGYTPGLGDVDGQFVAGWDFVNRDADPADDHGHGTRVTGILAAKIDNDLGLAGWCPRCRVMPVKVAGSSGTAAYSNIIAGIEWAADHGADVVNLSLGGASPSEAMSDAVAYARARGLVVVAAAGNNGCDCPRYPAAIPDVVAVGGSGQSDERRSTSNFGPWVDVAAPDGNVTTYPDGSFRAVGGTSSAAPVVAGIAGLALAADPTATGADVEQALRAGAVSIGDWVAHGRVDASATLATLGAPAPTPPTTTTTTTPPTTTTTTTTPPTTTTTAPPPEQSVTTTFSGTLNKRWGAASYLVDVGAGRLEATLSLARKKAGSHTLELVDDRGVPVASTNGAASPLVLVADVSAGRYVLRVTDGSGGHTLVVTHARG